MAEPKAKPSGSTTNAESKTAPNPESASDAKDDLKTLPMAEVEKKLGSSPDGVTQAEAQKRLQQYGPNDIEEKKTNLLLKLVARHWPDFGIILVLLLANAMVGFWERTTGRRRDRRPEGQACDQSPREA